MLNFNFYKLLFTKEGKCFSLTMLLPLDVTNVPTVAVCINIWSCATQLHKPPDDVINPDTTSLSFQICLGPPQLIQCINNGYIGYR
ncbi:MAG: hypothetical protein ATN34_03175 [Epulopiscium sp. Nele67-Bin002]|nr:MAG: hypothetical protein ATN34_03175 [Epulopiscium sp. Nele67-Bin002]